MKYIDLNNFICKFSNSENCLTNNEILSSIKTFNYISNFDLYFKDIKIDIVNFDFKNSRLIFDFEEDVCGNIQSDKL